MSAAGPPLRELQQALQAWLLHGEENVIRHVERPPLESERVRLAIYAEAYALRLTEVLATEYPALAALLGQRGFAELARAFARSRPSRFRSVRWYGGGLPAFVADTAPWSARPELAELAAFEWALSLAFDAADREAPDLSWLAALPAEHWALLRMRLHPACRRLDLRGNAAELRRAVDAGEPPPPPRLDGQPAAWLVWRRRGACRYRALDSDEAWALDRIAADGSFGDVCEGLLEWHEPERVALQAASMLKTWIDDEVVHGLSVPEAPAPGG